MIKGDCYRDFHPAREKRGIRREVYKKGDGYRYALLSTFIPTMDELFEVTQLEDNALIKQIMNGQAYYFGYECKQEFENDIPSMNGHRSRRHEPKSKETILDGIIERAKRKEPKVIKPKPLSKRAELRLRASELGVRPDSLKLFMKVKKVTLDEAVVILHKVFDEERNPVGNHAKVDSV